MARRGWSLGSLSPRACRPPAPTPREVREGGVDKEDAELNKRGRGAGGRTPPSSPGAWMGRRALSVLRLASAPSSSCISPPSSFPARGKKNTVLRLPFPAHTDGVEAWTWGQRHDGEPLPFLTTAKNKPNGAALAAVAPERLTLRGRRVVGVELSPVPGCGRKQRIPALSRVGS